MPVSPYKLVVVFVSLASTVACGELVEPLGDAAVRATFSLAPGGCEGAGVDEVVLEVDGAEVARGECAAGALRADAIAPGRYPIRLVGLDPSGVPTYGASLGEVTLRGDVMSTLEPARLTALPARAHASWRFWDGSVCGALGVESVEASVFDALGWEFATVTLPCDAGSGAIGEVPAGAHMVWVHAVGDDGARYEGVADVVLKRGGESTAEGDAPRSGGLTLLRSLCTDFSVCGTGNRARAVFDWAG